MNYLINEKPMAQYFEESEAKLNELLAGKVITDKFNNARTISGVLSVGFSSTASAILKIDDKKYSLDFYLEKGLLDSIDPEILAQVSEIVKEITEHTTEYNRLCLQERLAIADEKSRARKEEEKQKAIQRKLESSKASNMAKAKNLSESVKLEAANELYVSIGYLAKHAKKLTATMPDYMDSWFVKEFGPAEHRLVDQSKLTSGGNAMQWTLGLKLDLDTNENITNYLKQFLGATKNEIQLISSTEFLFRLARDFNFTFGKQQDLEKIKSTVPAEYLNDFEIGYNL